MAKKVGFHAGWAHPLFVSEIFSAHFWVHKEIKLKKSALHSNFYFRAIKEH